jgi:hypothetical protein
MVTLFAWVAKCVAAMALVATSIEYAPLDLLPHFLHPFKVPFWRIVFKTAGSTISACEIADRMNPAAISSGAATFSSIFIMSAIVAMRGKYLNGAYGGKTSSLKYGEHLTIWMVKWRIY